MKTKALIIVLGVVALAGVAFALWRGREVSPVPGGSESSVSPSSTAAPGDIVVEDSGGLGAEVFERSQNPLKDELPETNPFKTETNPLEGIYKNPFE